MLVNSIDTLRDAGQTDGSGSDFWPERKSRLGVSEEKIFDSDVVAGSLVAKARSRNA
jgi:hypothetical protein